nr:pseudaminic acid synthase [Candidatus Planktophila dulcis]
MRDYPLFVAEISANHMGSLDRAHQLIEASVDAGATAVKFQTYTPDTMTLNLESLAVSGGHELWGGRALYTLYQEAMTPWEWHAELFEHCRNRGVIPFSSPFDPTAVEFLESLNAPMYKIASLETSDHQLIRLVGETGKPTIVSTGATELEEIEELVSVFRATGNQDLTLLVCTSSYPAQPRDANVNRMELLREKFNVRVGLSDHTLGIGTSIAAIALGATVIEKHITLDRRHGGLDSAFSMEPAEFAQLVLEGKSASESLGVSSWSIQPSESESRRLRRSLYIVQDVLSGDFVSHENVRAIRPGYGAHPRYLDGLIGQKFNSDYAIGTPMSQGLVD